MSEVVVGVRLTADGSGLVGQLKLSRAEMTALRSEEKGVAQAAGELAASTDRLSAAASQGAAALRDEGHAARDVAQGMREARQSAQEYAGMAAQLRSELDPMFAVQQRFDRELERADRLFAAGAISAREYGAAQRMANDNLRAGHAAIFSANAGLGDQAKNLGLARAGWQSTGQQLQDVFVQYGAGASATSIFAMQSGQLASAVSMIGAASGNTTTLMGRFFGLMGGPWGIAVGVGVSVLGALTMMLTRSGEEAGKSKKTMMSLADAFDQQRHATAAAKEAIEDYNDAQARARTNAAAMIKLNLAAAEAQLKVALATRTRLAAELAVWEAQARRGAQSEAGEVARQGAFRRADSTRAAIAENNAAIVRDAQAVRNLRIQDAERDAKAAIDPIAAINNKYDDMAEAAKRAAAGNNALSRSLEGTLVSYERARKADLDRHQRQARDTRGSGVSPGAQASLGDMVALMKQLFPGARITSTTGGKHTKGSDHYAGRAIDFVPAGGMGAYTTAEVEAMLESAGVDIRRNASGKKQIFGPGRGAKTPNDHADHFHVAWQGSAPDPEKVAAAARKAQADLEEFGERSAGSIAQINAQFDAQPRLIDAAAKAMRDLDRIEADLADRPLTPNIEQLKGAIDEARTSIVEGLTRPYDDFLAQARETAEIDALILAGREDEARALQVALRLQAQMGPLTDEQLRTVLDIVEAERGRGEVLAQHQEKIDLYLGATREVRGEIEAIIAGQGKFSNFRAIFRQLQAKVTTEQLFGPALRGLDEWVRRDAMAPAIDRLSKNADRAGEAVTDFASAARRAIARIENRDGAGASRPAAADGSAAASGVIAAAVAGVAGGGAGTADAGNDDIVVIGQKPDRSSVFDLPPSLYFEELVRSVTDPFLDGLDKHLGIKFFAGLKGVVSGAAHGYLTAGPAGGILGALKSISGLPESVSAKFDEALKGAQTGTVVAGVMKGLGIKTSSTGAQIGGAIGAALPIPGGEILGSIWGGIVGGLFKKTKTGSATVGNVDGVADITSTAGNSKSRITAARGLASGALGAIDQIIEQLNGELGSFAGSIGVRNKKFVVDPSGQGRTKGSGVLKFKTEEEANAALLADLIADGAVKGVSLAVQRALGSSPDIQKAVSEALKVQEVETLIGGVGATLAAEFKVFDRQAAERVRIAEKYGFDLVALEKRNGEDRKKLTEQLLADQVGGLQRLIDEMTGGGLFEGSAADLRISLLGQIDAAKAEVDAGVEGAGDKLAGLYERLNSVSKDVFGTTGGFAADRSSILSGAQATIERANQRIAEAQKISDPALAATNAALNENNDQNAQIIAGLALSNELLRDILAGGGATDHAGLAALARTS